MKTRILWSLLLCAAMAIPAYAQTDVAKDPKQQKKEAQEAEGVLKFKTALAALEARNFIIEKYDPRSTSKSTACYDYIVVEGDSIFTQGVWAAAQGAMNGGGFSQSTGKIVKLELTPDKKGNILGYLEANMITLEGRAKNSSWLLKRQFKLFKNTNSVPWPDGLQGFVVLPSQSHIKQLKGAMQY